MSPDTDCRWPNGCESAMARRSVSQYYLMSVKHENVPSDRNLQFQFNFLQQFYLFSFEANIFTSEFIWVKTVKLVNCNQSVPWKDKH